MITFQKAEPSDIWLTKKQQWRLARISNTTFTAMISCPVCGRTLSLSKYSIDEDGKVSPSVVCYYANHEAKDCTFHDFIRLEAWK